MTCSGALRDGQQARNRCVECACNTLARSLRDIFYRQYFHSSVFPSPNPTRLIFHCFNHVNSDTVKKRCIRMNHVVPELGTNAGPVFDKQEQQTATALAPRAVPALSSPITLHDTTITWRDCETFCMLCFRGPLSPGYVCLAECGRTVGTFRWVSE